MEYSLGLVEVSALGNAIIMLDSMLKVADVEFVATERKLGGRLVTIVVKGELTSVKAAVDAGVEIAKRYDCFKAVQVIARPHSEIFKFLHLEEEDKTPNAEIAGTHVGAVKPAPKKTPTKSAKKGTSAKKTETPVSVTETKVETAKEDKSMKKGTSTKKTETPVSVAETKSETAKEEKPPTSKRRGRPKKTQ